MHEGATTGIISATMVLNNQALSTLMLNFALQDLLVWRQEHPEQKGHYAYKMYGRFDDVSAFEFLEVQVTCQLCSHSQGWFYSFLSFIS